MTGEPRCDRTDLLVRDCSHCRGLDPPRPAPAPTYSTPPAPIPARWRAWCRGCRGPIEPGEFITKTGPDRDDPWVHVGCEGDP